jgi:hypothetical protein
MHHHTWLEKNFLLALEFELSVSPLLGRCSYNLSHSDSNKINFYKEKNSIFASLVYIVHHLNSFPENNNCFIYKMGVT